MFAQNNDYPLLVIEALIVLSRFVEANDTRGQKGLGNSQIYYSLLIQGENSIFPLFWSIIATNLPDSTPSKVRPFVAREDLKIAMIRFVKNLIYPSGFKAGQESLKRGFSTQRIFDFYLECVRETRFPPKQHVAQEAMDLMILTKESLTDVTIQQVVMFIQPLTQWLAQSDPNLIHSALGVLEMLLSTEKAISKFA